MSKQKPTRNESMVGATSTSIQEQTKTTLVRGEIAGMLEILECGVIGLYGELHEDAISLLVGGTLAQILSILDDECIKARYEGAKEFNDTLVRKLKPAGMTFVAYETEALSKAIQDTMTQLRATESPLKPVKEDI